MEIETSIATVSSVYAQDCRYGGLSALSDQTPEDALRPPTRGIPSHPLSFRASGQSICSSSGTVWSGLSGLVLLWISGLKIFILFQSIGMCPSTAHPFIVLPDYPIRNRRNQPCASRGSRILMPIPLVVSHPPCSLYSVQSRYW